MLEDVSSAISEGIIHSYLQPIEHAHSHDRDERYRRLSAGTPAAESVVGQAGRPELEAETRVPLRQTIAATLTDILARPVKAEPVTSLDGRGLSRFKV